MIVTYNWLKEFVDITQTPEELSSLLTMLGLEVERMESVGGEYDSVIIARVESRLQHPNADKLSVCKVNNGTEILDIVCGASNFKAGDTVALAQVGSVLPGDFRIKKSKIRGEESCGMLCSEKELGLAEESEGILILQEGLTLGQPLFSALGLKDTIFEIGLTPNRADCLSVVGIAREIAAKLGLEVKYPDFAILESAHKISDTTSVTIDDPDLCPRYTARLIRGCTIAPSPSWLVKRLSDLGVRSINNVVDITNYVLMEFGHPLHAFDFDLLEDGRIIVRRAADGEVFKTLDGQERILTHDDLTIRDGKRAVALAGIMGGENSEISPDTVNILLESAYFTPLSIRRTSKRLGLRTESSHRFERGTDLDGLTNALNRAASLILQLAGGEIAEGLIDAYPTKISKPSITLRVSRVNSILGTSLALDEVHTTLSSLFFTVKQSATDTLVVDVPLYRVDIDREIDLIEEVARLIGYEAIPVTLPSAQVETVPVTPSQHAQRQLRDLMVAQGFNEVINFSFTHPQASAKLLIPEDDPRARSIKLLNPLVEEQSVMRTTLIPSLLETVEHNLNHRRLNQRIFELRRLYLENDGDELPREPLWLGAVITGLRNQESWCTTKDTVDFYDMKGVAEAVLRLFDISRVTYATDSPEPYYHPGKSCTIWSGKTRIGAFGEIHPDVQANFGLLQPCLTLEMSVDSLMKAASTGRTVQAPSRYPDSYRDVALLLDEGTPAAELIEAVKKLNLRELVDISIFDVYRGSSLPEGKKSVALRLRYLSFERTLNDEEVTKLHQRATALLVEKFGAVTR